MPLYSYRCKACAHEFETLVRSDETPFCASCGSPEIDRMVSATAAEGKSKTILKGARTMAAREGHLSNFGRSER